MRLDRRTFLRGLGAGALGSLAGVASARADGDGLPTFTASGADGFWQAVRAQYPLLDDPLYLNTGGLGPVSRPVLAAVETTARRLQEHSESGHGLFEPAREGMARFLGAQPEEICFVRNATEGNSIIAAGLALGPGDEVIFDSHAHPGGSFPWFNQAKQRGVVVKLFEPDPAADDGNLARILALVTPRTKVVQLSHLTCTTGQLLPVPLIAEAVRRRGIWLHVDGAQAAGMIPLDLRALGSDSYAFSGHKWLGGPHETGVLFIRRDRLEEVAPTGIGAYSGELAQLPGELKYHGAASRHEYGTRNAAQVEGLLAAVRLQEQIGRERVAQHGADLASLLQEELAAVDGITVLTPAARSMRGSIITIRHTRADAGKFFGYLLERHRLRCRPVTEQDLRAVRISTHVFNSRADCRRVIAAVRASVRDL
ncbi:aminotransferase class V-fold PLP-dependent enzyme [Oleiharenicola lentus]|uniref:Aminotransferase class V-fold PLP-dependent enzyme n=1 Tax=Oleiharenicola lentus TaxID=2508720 RepID=A0A4Q1CB94_9BACT|nr:aminotransferase class V-fold PLP-dependent enzyme [Oleiharenicola lentus]RXK56230.1 aminotransferase class V-fold PLP-dependent enzyme [Oleiharenicola lentus]